MNNLRIKKITPKWRRGHVSLRNIALSDQRYNPLLVERALFQGTW
jgi:hypothetical protein